MVSKSLHGTYPIVKSNHAFMSRRSRSQVFALYKLDLGTSHQTRVLPGRIQNRCFRKGFSLRHSAGAYRRKSQHFKTSLPAIAVCLSVYRVKYMNAAKVKLNHRSKLTVQESAALRTRFTLFTLRASQFRITPFLNRCGFAVYTTNETVWF